MKKLLLLLGILISFAAQAQLTPFFSGDNNKYGYKDEKGTVKVSPRYDLAYPLVDGMAAVKSGGKYGYINAAGKEIVAPKYDFTWHFIGGCAAVKLGNQFGFIDKTGKEVIPPKYEEANNFHGECCYKGMGHVKENGKWKIIKL